jgi:hypothetical protein
MPNMYRLRVQVSGENFAAQSIQFYVVVPNGSNTPEVLDESSWRRRLLASEPIPVQQIEALAPMAH